MNAWIKESFGLWVPVLIVALICGCMFWSCREEEENRWDRFKENINRGEDVVLIEHDENYINEAISKFATYGYCLKTQNTRVNGGLVTSTSNAFVFHKCR